MEIGIEWGTLRDAKPGGFVEDEAYMWERKLSIEELIPGEQLSP